ncbi:CDP-glycerol glycerophosphotransferase family protein [Macrococcoides canis]|nr:CDP-glycerol glycerophosphotransferase family protein [Macrococcus canis]
MRELIDMMRSIIKASYLKILAIFTLVFKFNKVSNNKITIYVTFLEDIEPILKQIPGKFEVVLIYHPKLEKDIKAYNYFSFPQSNKGVVRELYHLSTSKWIIVDTYYLILAGIKKKKGQKLIQTWHAAGALKKFGLQDHSLKNATEKTIKQYKLVYNTFDYVLVGSKAMENIFKKSFGLSDSNFLRIGLPRMDKYKKLNRKNENDAIRKQFGIPEEKIVVSYVPTYRDYEMVLRELPVDFSTLDDRYQCFVKLHPAVKLKTRNKWYTEMTTTELLLISDVIITDYSSLAMEASFLNIPVLFYNYDIDEYDEKRGLVDNYFEYIDSESIQTNDVLLKRLGDTLIPNETLNKRWNEYNNGDATSRLIKFISEES